ncbi:MAG: hypothetical protein R2731_15125 [Nocardioides sp.]
MPDYVISPPRRHEVRIGGHGFGCLICGGSVFAKREIKLNTTGLTLFDLDCANRSSIGVSCCRCGYMHEFLPGLVEFVEPSDKA